MRRRLYVLAAVLAAATPAAARAQVQPGPWCGGRQWRLMAFSDADRNRVRLQRAPTTIADVARVVPPRRIGATRATPFQRQVWGLHVVIDRFRIASNGELVFVLYSIDSGTYMNAYLPNPHCLGPRTRDRTGILAARRAFTAHCPPAKPEWQLLGATADLAGIGFWNPVRSTRGALPNGAELRPLTNLRIVSGCGVG